MEFKLTFEQKKAILRISAMVCGLAVMFPSFELLKTIMEYQIFSIVTPGLIIGGLAVLFGFGSFRKMW